MICQTNCHGWILTMILAVFEPSRGPYWLPQQANTASRWFILNPVWT